MAKYTIDEMQRRLLEMGREVVRPLSSLSLEELRQRWIRYKRLGDEKECERIQDEALERKAEEAKAIFTKS